MNKLRDSLSFFNMVEYVQEGDIMKKIIIYILAILSCTCLFACGQANNEEIQNDDPIVEEKAELATVSEKVVYEDKHISITVKESTIGFAENQFNFPLRLSFTNKTNQEITISNEYTLINDIFVQHNYPLIVTISPKSSVEYDWLFDDIAHAHQNIKTIGSISFCLNKYIGNQVERTDVIRVESDHKDYVQKINTEGKILIDEQGYKIIGQDAELRSESEYYCWFYLENNTNEEVLFQIEPVSVNGFVIKTKSMPRTLFPANAKGYISLIFTEEDIEKYDLNPINRMYVEVSVLDDLGPHHYGEEIVKNRSVKVEYGE